MLRRRLRRPLPLPNLPATESVELSRGLRYEGVWVDGRWVWTLWLGARTLLWNPQARLGSYAAS